METVPEGPEPFSFDPAENLRRDQGARATRAAGRLATLSPLPVRPDRDWYRGRAKDLLRLARVHRPDTKLSEVQHGLARSLGWLNWRSLIAEIDRRNVSSRRLAQAIAEGDDRAIRAALEADVAALLDAALLADSNDIRWLRPIAEACPTGEAFLRVLHDTLAERGTPASLAGSLDALFDSRNDYTFAMDAIFLRITSAGSGADREAEVEQLEDARGVLANYDEPEFEQSTGDD